MLYFICVMPCTTLVPSVNINTPRVNRTPHLADSRACSPYPPTHWFCEADGSTSENLERRGVCLCGNTGASNSGQRFPRCFESQRHIAVAMTVPPHHAGVNDLRGLPAEAPGVQAARRFRKSVWIVTRAVSLGNAEMLKDQAQPWRHGGRRVVFKRFRHFCVSSLLRKPQYPTMGHAPHSGRERNRDRG